MIVIPCVLYFTRLVFSFVDPAHPFDSATGEKRGRYTPSGYTFEHYIFLSEDKKERRKQLEDLVSKCIGTHTGNLERGHLSYRNPSPDNSHSGTHGGDFNWDQFCDLSIEELGECQNKRCKAYKEISQSPEKKQVVNTLKEIVNVTNNQNNNNNKKENFGEHDVRDLQHVLAELKLIGIEIDVDKLLGKKKKESEYIK
jgi:hypothetical protein